MRARNSTRSAGPRRLLAGGLAVVGLLAVGTAPAGAAYGITDFATTASTAQAGGHPDVSVDMTFSRQAPPPGGAEAANDGHTRDVQVDLPAGLSGNPENIEQCTQQQFDGSGCPASSQVGVLGVNVPSFGPAPFIGGVWLMRPRNGDETARLATRVAVLKFAITISVRSDGDFGLRSVAAGLPSGDYNPYGLHLTLWGVPADSSHDLQRLSQYGSPLGGNDPNPPYDPLPYPLPITVRAFMTNPTSCGPQAPATLVARSFEDPDALHTASAAPLPDITGCALEPFAPAFAFQPVTRRADTPSGFDATVTVPQQPDALGNATAHVRKVDVTLPEGVAIAPPSADGLLACSDDQLRAGTLEDAACPAASRIGDVAVDVPVLSAPLSGGVYLRTPTPGHLFRLALVASGSGVKLKVLGEALPDPATGRLRAVFDETPQQPFSQLRLRFDGGPRAPLATPQRCTAGAVTSGSITGWNGAVQAFTDTFAIDADADGGACPATVPFDPSLAAGASGTAGASSAFTLRVARADGRENLGAITTVLPPGLLAHLGDVPLCPAAAASTGACPAASQVGTTTVGAGSGSAPLFVHGKVFLTDAYKNGPFGLAIVVPTAGQAGPFDLGDVVVRAALTVDPTDAHVTVVSDPLPTILQGVPLRLRDVRVAIDRPGFMVNPTRCTPSQVGATVTSASGTAAPLASRFQVGECAALGFAPRLSLGLSGKGQTGDGAHPALTAHLAPRPGDANSASAKVTLPLSLALDPDNAEALCEPSAAAAGACPAASIVGQATAVSVLHEPLTGPVYFVRGERTDPKSGRIIKTLPTLSVPLTGEGVRVNLRATSAVVADHLVTTFAGLPDVPLRSFDLHLAGGKHGILVVSGTSLCRATQLAAGAFGAQSGKVADAAIVIATPCALGVVGASHTATTLTVVVGGIGAGRVSVGGAGLTRRARTIGTATTASVTVPLSRSLRHALARGRSVTVAVAVAFTPKGTTKATRITKRLTIHGGR